MKMPLEMIGLARMRMNDCLCSAMFSPIFILSQKIFIILIINRVKMATRISRHGSKHGLVAVVVCMTGGERSELYPLCTTQVPIGTSQRHLNPIGDHEDDLMAHDGPPSGENADDSQVGSLRSTQGLKDELEDGVTLEHVSLCNVPVIHYPVQLLESIFTPNGMASVAIVVQAEDEQRAMKHWIDRRYASQPQENRPHVIVTSDPESSAHAVRQVFDQGLGLEFECAETIIVLRSNVVTDVHLASVVAQHRLTSATATVMLAHSREEQLQASSSLKKTTSSVTNKSSSTIDKSTTFIGLDPNLDRLCFWMSNDTASDNQRRGNPQHYGGQSNSVRQLQLPLRVLKAVPHINILTNLMDTEVCIFNRSVVEMLTRDKKIDSVSGDLIPLLVKQQFQDMDRKGREGKNERSNSSDEEAKHDTPSKDEKSPDSTLNKKVRESMDEGSKGKMAEDSVNLSQAKLNELISEMSHTYVEDTGFNGNPPKTLCNVFIVPPEKYCAKLNSIEAYGDISKDLTSGEFSHMLPPNSGSMPSDVGSKSTMGAGCVFGESVSIGDKCSIKRSIIGDKCKIGNNVKIVNSVLMADTCVEDGSHIQNCIICKEVSIGEKCTLKDCCVGPQWAVAAGLEHRGETLAQSFNDFL